MESDVLAFRIGQCVYQREYEELVNTHKALYTKWKDYIGPLMTLNGLKTSDIAKGCGVAEGNARQFLHKIPAKRENVIMIAMLMGFSVEETDQMLMRHAQFQGLYSKNPKDFIWLYLIEQGRGKTFIRALREREAINRNVPGRNNRAGIAQTTDSIPPRENIPGSLRELFDDYYHRYQELSEEYRESALLGYVPDTVVVRRDVLKAAGNAPSAPNAREDTQFTKAVRKNLPAFDAAYQKLVDYIESLFPNHEQQADEALNIETAPPPGKNPKSGTAPKYKKTTANMLFQDCKTWKDLYFRKMRDLREKHELPRRSFLIALGIHLHMSTDQINELLTVAGMNELCSKDHLESAIIFYLEELYCLFPVVFNPAKMEVVPEYQDTMNYSREQSAVPGDENYNAYLRTFTDEDDLLRDDFSRYIRRRLEETNIFETDDKKAVKKFLEML